MKTTNQQYKVLDGVEEGENEGGVPPLPPVLHYHSLLHPCKFKATLRMILMQVNPATLTAFTVVCAFSAYFSVYGITSSLFAATFEGIHVFGKMQLKVAFSISQLLGYAASKVVATFVIPTIHRDKRCRYLMTLVILGDLPLIFFGFLPPIGQILMVFLNAIPMAWVWGIMVMYLEGRKTSEILLMGLFLSVMVAGGVVRSIATYTMQHVVSENWMPALCGSVAACVFLVFTNLLDTIPDPSKEDKIVRLERRTMSPEEGRAFLRKWAPGLLFITIVYAVLTAYRNFRDYFSAELWRDLLGPHFNPSKFTQSEIPVGICTAFAYSLLYWIKDNRKGFFAILGVMFMGGLVILLATITQVLGWLSPLPWMIAVGTGLFMAYIPPGAMLYDRFNGATGVPYTSVFMIYLSDICGYSITLTVLFYRCFGDAQISYVPFFQTFSYITSFVCMAGMCVAALYFSLTLGRMNANGQREVVVDVQEMQEVEHL